VAGAAHRRWRGGKGGKYLILPPDYADEVPTGYIPLRPKTYNSYMLIRCIVASRSEEDVRAGDALVQQIRIYPLSQAGNPPKPRFVDMTDKLYNAVVPYDDSFYDSLARVINEEPVQSRDLEVMGMLLPLGIEKDKEFKPDLTTRTQLKAAAARISRSIHWTKICKRMPMAPWTSTSAQRHPPARSRTGFTPRQGRIGIRGFDSMAHRRQSSTRIGNCRTSRKKTAPDNPITGKLWTGTF
jgi:hypothetical protein